MRSGYRVGSYLVLVDTEGLRHSVRLSAILSVSDADMCQDTTVVIAAGRQILVPEAWETVMTWIDGAAEALPHDTEPSPAAKGSEPADAVPESVLDIAV
jgi:hypothetical protein